MNNQGETAMHPLVQKHLPDYPVVIQQTVAWGDMDAYRHVNNVVYFRYLENARLEYLERLGVLSTRPLLAHCVTVSDSDIARIARNRAAIAHCPKSNAKFGHGYAPLEKFLNAGIAVGLGSDSVASNNSCDLLEESRFAALAARNLPGSERFLTAREVLEAATLGGPGRRA